MKRLTLILILLILACVVPIVNVEYTTIENRQVEETYTIIEPYTIQVEVLVPYTTYATSAQWVDDGSWDYAKNYIAFTTDEYMTVFRSVTPGRYVMIQYPVTRFRTETQTITKFREVVKTRTVSVPTTITVTKHIPIIRLGGAQ